MVHHDEETQVLTGHAPGNDGQDKLTNPETSICLGNFIFAFQRHQLNLTTSLHCPSSREGREQVSICTSQLTGNPELRAEGGTIHCRKLEEKQPTFSQAKPQLKGDRWGAGEVERELNR